MASGKYNKTKKHKEKISRKLKGRHVSPKTEFKKEHKHSEGMNKGENNPNWKGGISLINLRIRVSKEYRLWKKAVFERDNYTCIWCGKKEFICADHIKSFSQFPELRFAIDNGRTLCRDCHKTTSNYAGKVNKSERR